MDFFGYEGCYYYTLKIPDTFSTSEKAFHFTSGFSVSATPLDPEEYEKIKQLKGKGDSVSNGMVYIRILEDLGEVADVDTDYILHKEDIVSVSPGLADVLISQGKAERMEVV